MGQFVLEKFVERFGSEQIVGANTSGHSDGGYGVTIIAKEKTEEMRDFAIQLSDELYEKRVYVSIPIMTELRIKKISACGQRSSAAKKSFTVGKDARRMQHGFKKL